MPAEAGRWRSPLAPLALGIEALLLYIATLGDLRSQVPAFWSAIFPAFALYALAALWVLQRPRGSLCLILAAAFAFRLTMLFSPPSLSDDIYRYLWDGRVQEEAGINPYRYPPDAPELLPLRDALHARINHPHVPTIYPPLAQFFFRLLAAVEPTVAAFKLALAACDMALCLLLARLLARRGQDERRVLLYAWHPLPLVEVAGSGHVDALGVLLLFLALYWALDRRPWAAASALAAAVLAKLVPALLLPAFWKHWAPARRGALLLFAALVLAAFLPFADAGAALFRGLGAYLRHWHFNDSIYALLRAGLAPFDPAAALHARWLCSALLAAFLLVVLRALDDLLRAAFWIMGAYVLASPTAHPWYLLWVLPFAPFFPRPAWILLGGLVFLAYEVLIDYSLSGTWSEENWVRWAQYGPFCLLLALSWLRPRLRHAPPPANGS